MKKIDLGQAIQILANLGVLAGIVFLALQIRQNTNATVRTAVQSVSEGVYELNAMLVENADLRAAYIAALAEGSLDDLTEDQSLQLRAYYALMVRSQQNRYQQIRLGILEDEDVYSLGRAGNIFFRPAFREYWQSTRDRYSAEFVEWFETNVLEQH